MRIRMPHCQLEWEMSDKSSSFKEACMYENILVPLDGSETGEAALMAVEELVSKLTPAHTVEVNLL